MVIPVTGQPKMLIADDYAPLRRTLRDYAEALGYSVVEAIDGRDAVEVFGKEAPDWTLMDLEMPFMDGLKATRAILQQNSAARVIVVTQHDDPVWRDEAKEAGAVAFFSKDEIHELGEMLGQHQEKRKPNQPTQDQRNT